MESKDWKKGKNKKKKKDTRKTDSLSSKTTRSPWKHEQVLLLTSPTRLGHKEEKNTPGVEQKGSLLPRKSLKLGLS
jgi:hypothetical protein